MKKLDGSTVERPELPVTILQFGAGNPLAPSSTDDRPGEQAGVTRDGVAVVQARPPLAGPCASSRNRTGSSTSTSKASKTADR